MPAPQHNIRSCAPAPLRWHLPQLKRSIGIKAAILAVFCFLTYAILYGPTGQIHLDTGDLRTTCCGIPTNYRPMPEPYRSTLQRLTARIPGTTNTWATCGNGHKNSEYNPDHMCQQFYYAIAMWANEDPNIANWLLDDTVSYIQRPNSALPESAQLFNGFLVDTTTRKIDPAWRDDPSVQYFCAFHSYKPPPPPQPPAN